MEFKIIADTMWVLITAMLVFFMNLGFAAVETGFARAKNAVNILSKNFIVFAVSSIAFWLVGWGIMFGNGNPLIGLQGLVGLSGADNSPAVGAAYQGVYSAISWASVPLLAKFFFQLVFAGTAATIVSGAVAERIKYLSFIIFSFFMVGLIYPIIGHWIWGGGWLAALGFWDFAGSSVVHSVGGWAALAGILMLGPRLGKYRKDGSPSAIPGHNIGLATIGAFVLWLGWFGFNPGSTMAADVNAISRIVVTTNLAAAAGILTSTLLAWFITGKPDLGMTINGCLGGLVAVTAPCAYISPLSSLIIGGIAGILVVLGVLFFDRLKLDDPVGALSVHLLNGVFGTLAVGLFAQDIFMPNTTGNGLFFGGGFKLLSTQFMGVLAVASFTLLISLTVWFLIKTLLGIRVSPEEEMRGLDIGEHGMEAYAGFQIFTAQ
ncbi:ammonia permease [candidate division WOR-1 bacterium RIFOXYA12_FULL_43_27]|uniref:Ammonium transporter n=1 Tax=candidate division WOR-1 bacterium RIFOXYC2_FULL_46_14 TaxID=1802587 RepID=A0A1F4U7T4_UNCSA|nr:MAG: ammonia permease [candidate division WOR-1 bacterium RIFOXYA12_FULL_43_27]OGC19357.1 MAG: ammonia permease [candidate division WOR-1 bacterium RIFOXYB2_FULL_46_45]OGC30346.1 MAG: ammonia permease [candidate division WOR-1 bacterium RIFOXYA2_FULL_46_56]OGC40947.1 MAG: ammonia permease [candidate division WOR-1 bacterium RIFOXYC2_FULL_46_14]